MQKYRNKYELAKQLTAKIIFAIIYKLHLNFETFFYENNSEASEQLI